MVRKFGNLADLRSGRERVIRQAHTHARQITQFFGQTKMQRHESQHKGPAVKMKIGTLTRARFRMNNPDVPTIDLHALCTGT